MIYICSYIGFNIIFLVEFDLDLLGFVKMCFFFFIVCICRFSVLFFSLKYFFNNLCISIYIVNR